MGIEELTPSIRADKEAFEKALDELGWTRRQYNNKIKRLGISLSDKTSTKNFLNDALKKIGSSFRYKNIMQAPTKIATEVRMGGVQPGRVGAPANEKIWSDGAKVQKVAEKKFKNVTDQRKFFVDTMKKLYKNVPKKEILHIFKNILRGIRSLNPYMLGTDIQMKLIEDPDYMNAIGFGESEPLTYKGGGMADIYEMTKPLGYKNGGDVETIPSKHLFSPDDINTIKNMLKSEMLRQNSQDINTDKIAYQFMAEMGYKPTEENLKGVQDAITMGIFDAQNELDRENTSDLGRLVGTARDKYQTFKKSEDKMGLIRNKIEEGLGALWQK